MIPSNEVTAEPVTIAIGQTSGVSRPTLALESADTPEVYQHHTAPHRRLASVGSWGQQYIKSSVGTCVDSTSIDTLEECERAAVALSLVDTTAQSG
jgi:hypothetical protein